jgi:hypothetical protein
MSLRNGLVLLLAVSTLSLLVACGSSSPKAVAPPTGQFTTSSLKGTYVFSVSGIDASGFPFAIVGSMVADGGGHITGGSIDINDEGFLLASSPVITPIANLPIHTNSSYGVGPDGRGQATIGTSAQVFGNIQFDFVLQNSFHGLITEFDGTASGSGTLDQQTAGLTQSSLTGSYAFSFSGADGNADPLANVGAFTLGSGGVVTAGGQDFNDANVAYPNSAITGQVTLGPTSLPATTQLSGAFSTIPLNFDVYAIDSTHLKFIEMDSSPVLSGDAYSQTTTTLAANTMAFTMLGAFPFSLTSDNPVAAGGFMGVDGAGNITSASSEDLNDGGTPSTSPLSFSGTYDSTGSVFPGRLNLNLSGFFGGTQFAAYPSSGGLLMLEIDNAGIMLGAAYPQTTNAFAQSQGYAMNLSGINVAAAQITGSLEEVDDIAEFSTTSNGTINGIIDENVDPNGTSIGAPTFDLGLSKGTYGSIDSNGRYGVGAAAGTLNGGFSLTLYSVDGINFPFIETDNGGQIAAGMVEQQNASATSHALVHPSMFMVHQLVRSQAARQKKK